MELPYYNTQDSMLAAGLKLFGCQHPKNEAGQIIPASNTFTPQLLAGILDENGHPRYKGKMTPEAAAVDAHKRGITGILIYHFEQSEDQRETCAGWSIMEEAFQKQQEERKAKRIHPDEEMAIDTLNISHSDLGKLLCMLEKKRKELFKLVRMTRPALALMETRVESTGERSSRITGSGKIRSLPL